MLTVVGLHKVRSNCASWLSAGACLHAVRPTVGLTRLAVCLQVCALSERSARSAGCSILDKQLARPWCKKPLRAPSRAGRLQHVASLMDNCFLPLELAEGSDVADCI